MGLTEKRFRASRLRHVGRSRACGDCEVRYLQMMQKGSECETDMAELSTMICAVQIVVAFRGIMNP